MQGATSVPLNGDDSADRGRARQRFFRRSRASRPPGGAATWSRRRSAARDGPVGAEPGRRPRTRLGPDSGSAPVTQASPSGFDDALAATASAAGIADDRATLPKESRSCYTYVDIVLLNACKVA